MPALRRCGIAALALLSTTSAWASDAEVTIVDGWVKGSIVVQADKARVLELLADPQAIARLDGRGSKITVRADGTCAQVESEVPSVMGLVKYTERRCPSDSGFHSWLVASEQFGAYEAIWRVEPVAGGIQVAYDLHTRPSIEVPDGLVDRVTRRAVRKLLGAIKDEVETAR